MKWLNYEKEERKGNVRELIYEKQSIDLNTITFIWQDENEITSFLILESSWSKSN